ncbi:nuclear transport factor 2 family protein [Sphingobacterium faecale]|uniref:Nuclear transport factor 2 family protein n=1 Tax=Sphingobacterium faecale TaxID=2803775 RepID=A0ABS1R665_9SPHI|nr:nuclear transport factor 2 family protein [Sphingobacterium faecale]MBL1410054.1 nuclear transport factor 2 family protein [Sphingobacterium faecale]
MQAKEIVASYFDALAKGDTEKVLSYFTPETKWSQPGDNKFSGLKNGPDEIFQMIGGMMSDTSGTMAVRINGSLMESGSLVAVPVWFTGNKETKNIDMGGIDLFELKDGKIVHIWTFSDDQDDENEFWGK